MSLDQWLKNNWLKKHKTSPDEIASLLAIVDRDLRDTGGGISADWRFGIAYNAARVACSVSYLTYPAAPATLPALPLLLQ